MTDTVQIDLGGGASVALPAEKVTQALISRLLNQSTSRPNRYAIGDYVPGQGGIFAGDIRGDDGIVYGLVTAQEDLEGGYEWSPSEGEIQTSDWDGLINTNALIALDSSHPAAQAAKAYSADGHADFYLPAQREMQIIAANLRHLFQKATYWTSTPYGSYNAWAVNFEHGHVYLWYRFSEFRVRPVRRFTY